jgi:prepilin peptidase CpaA
MLAIFNVFSCIMVMLTSILTLTLLVVTAFIDVATRTIPDCISVALLATGLIVGIETGIGTLASSLAVSFLVFAALAVIHFRGMLGGGDVKLMAATSVQFPPEGIWRLFVATSLAGGLLVLLHLALRRLPGPARCPPGSYWPRRVWTIERWRVRRRGSLPYGVAIACGGIWTILAGWRS